MSINKNTLNGDETLFGTNVPLRDASVLNFWRWAYSDLQSNDLRGVLAEWIVAKLLDIPLSPYFSWNGWDLITLDGIRLQVKSAAYRQTWHEDKDPHTTIQFKDLKKRLYDEKGKILTPEPDYNADLFVFSIQTNKGGEQDGVWNALDLEQWEFYVLTRASLKARKAVSIGYAELKKISPCLTADTFRYAVTEEIRKLKASLAS